MAGRGRNSTVCKFFLDGRCKFGDNCRYYHPTGNTGSNNRGWQSPGNNRSGYSQSSPHSGDFGRGWGQKHQGNRPQLFSERGTQDFGQRGGGFQHRDNSPRGNPFDHGRLGPRVNSGGQGGWNGGRTDRRNDGGWYQDRRNDSGWNQDRRNDSGWNGGQWGGGHRDGYNRRDQGNQQTASQPNTPKEVAQTIQEDMNEWSASGMWVLSCYAYHKDSPCVPGLLDVSPEELRYEAYKAKASGNSANYLQNLNQLGTKQMTVQRHLSSISIDDARSLLSLQSSDQPDSDISSGLFGASSSPTLVRKPSLFSDSKPDTSSLFGPSSSGPTLSSMFGGQEAQPNSLFGTVNTPQSTMESAGQPSTAPTTNTTTLFQQSRPQGTALQQATISTNTPPNIQPVVPATSATQAPSSSVQGTGKKTLKEIISYTQSRALTKQEIEAFNADKFVLGKIPEHAPVV